MKLKPRLNIHIYGSPITHESRIMRQTETMAQLGIVDHIYILGLWREDLPEVEPVDSMRTIIRFKLWSHKLGEGTFPKSFKVLEWALRIIVAFLFKRVAIVNIHYLAGRPLGVFFKAAKGSRLVYDTHELETERHGWGGGRRYLARLVEGALFRFIDETIVTSPGYADWYEQRYGKRPYTVVNAPRFTTPTKTNLLREHLDIPQDAMIFLYQGALGSGRNIETLIEAFSRCNNPRKVLVFMGFGPQEDLVKDAAKQHPNIYFYHGVAPDEVLRYTASADIGFCMIQNSSLSYRFTFPNKMTEYVMAGLPVIVAEFGEMRRLVEEYQIGYVARDGSVEDVLDLVQRINLDDLAAFKDKLAQFREDFNWEKQERVLSSIYKGLQSSYK